MFHSTFRGSGILPMDVRGINGRQMFHSALKRFAWFQLAVYHFLHQGVSAGTENMSKEALWQIHGHPSTVFHWMDVEPPE